MNSKQHAFGLFLAVALPLLHAQESTTGWGPWGPTGEGAATVSAEQLQQRIEHRRQPYVDNLQRIRDACDERGILFIVATQQAQSMMFQREALKGMTYKDEVEHVRKKLDEKRQLSPREAGLVLHDQLMDAMRQWVEQTNTPLVDIIAALDQDRDVLLSWVHLSPRGNDMIAQHFAEEIRRHHP